MPVLVQTHIRYLPYFNSTQHFPGHAVVICGYDDHEGTFYVSDTLYPEMLAVSYGNMEMARSSNFPPFQLRNKFFALHDLSGYRIDEAVILASIRQWAEENLLGVPGAPYTYGIAALERLIEDVHRWTEAPDWSWSARFTYQIIERRGTGGAAFRTLYRQFLEKEEEEYPALKKLALSVSVSVVERLYHEVAVVFRDISEREKPVFTPAQPILLNLLDGERTLYREILRQL